MSFWAGDFSILKAVLIRLRPYLNFLIATDKTGEKAIPELSFPGFSPESVKLLVEERNITGIAIDTPSIDYGKSKEFKVHQVLCNFLTSNYCCAKV